MRLGKSKKLSRNRESQDCVTRQEDKENIRPKEFGWRLRDDSLNTDMLSDTLLEDSVNVSRVRGSNIHPKSSLRNKASSGQGEQFSVLKDLTNNFQEVDNRFAGKGPDGKVLERLAKGEKTKLSKQEMMEINRRMRSRLPEVKQADEKKKIQDDIKLRKDKLKEFNKVSFAVTRIF